jgi:Predicted acetyltransferases and hydrolases with the alpha/beta hydrolase fold
VLPEEALLFLEKAEIFETGRFTPGELTIEQVRRRRLRRGPGYKEHEPVYFTLYEEDGVLRWYVEGDEIQSPATTSLRRRHGTFDVARRVIQEFKFQPAEGSQVAALLDSIDRALNESRDLRELVGGQLGPAGAVPKEKGTILLLVHGTFSKAQAMVDDLRALDGGNRLTALVQPYDQVLAFEHPTLSVSPILNAAALARLFARTKAEVHVISHSRGGLVVRWWLEALNRNSALRSRVALVGSPLNGTSLASPFRLRKAIDHLTNVGFALGTAGTLAASFAPWIGALGGLLRILSSATATVAKTPTLDAAVALIPGLAGQSKIPNNFELQELRSGAADIPASYSFLRSNFEPFIEDYRWGFLKYFTRFGTAIRDASADLVFPGANDLVVDTDSMTYVKDAPPTPTSTAPAAAPVPAEQIHDFGTSKTVHHLNYFAQPATLDFIESRFRAPRHRKGR